MINKNIALLCILIMIMPGCGWWKKSAKPEHKGNVKIEQEKTKEHGKKSDRKSLFLDDSVKDFTFEEEAGTNVFSSDIMQDSSKINLVETPFREWEERKAQQSKYGFKTVYFGFDQYSLKPDQEAALEQNIAAIKKLPRSAHFIIEGHACNIGKGYYNILLSEKRAQAVARWLIKHGISADRLQTVGRGFEMCVVSTGTKEQLAPNRRVEIHVKEDSIIS